MNTDAPIMEDHQATYPDGCTPDGSAAGADDETDHWFLLSPAGEAGPLRKAELIEMFRRAAIPPDAVVRNAYSRQHWMMRDFSPTMDLYPNACFAPPATTLAPRETAGEVARPGTIKAWLQRLATAARRAQDSRDEKRF